jgi:GTP-binding protein HflX
MPKHIAIQPSDEEITILVGLVSAGTSRQVVEDHLDELERLVDTAGGRVVERMTQERPAADPATLVGSGFVAKVAAAAAEHGARSVVFDEDLTASQVRNLEQEMPDGVKVLDRAAVILDIFAARARSSEAMTQVELAQLSYLLPRLTRRWGHLSRQAGGIGTRGVGETQLEIDRRLVSKRISQLKGKLAIIERDRRLRRERRRELPAVALVGYTNAGKSSLFRRLSKANVLVEDRLFATLDPRARRVSLGQEVTVVMTDTVGFIRKLPHDLVAPFRSTLEETVDADLVLHVVDVSHPLWEEHLRVGDEVLEGLGVSRERQLVVLNKIDLIAGSVPLAPAGWQAVSVSAVEGTGVGALRHAIRSRLLSGPGVAILRIPLEEPEAVRRAVGLPHQLARRYRAETVELATRVDAWRLREVGLDEYRVSEWGGAGDGGL